ncbi:MAG: glycoside hydrolase family 16 protein [Acidimicrobiales bacterium]
MSYLWKTTRAKHRARPVRKFICLSARIFVLPIATKRTLAKAVLAVSLASLVAAAPVAATLRTQGPPTPFAGMQLAFSATFTGSQLNSSAWQTCYPGYTQGQGCTNFGNAQEEEWYLPSQVQVSNGALHLVASETPTAGWNSSQTPVTYPYASGMVTTFQSFQFTYGYVQIVARIPGGTGTWPALWLLPANESWPPEIDIMENWGSLHTVRETTHWPSPGGQEYQSFATTTPSDLTAGWHTYALLWSPGSLTWYLDGNVVARYLGSNVPSQPMYLLANLAIDGAAAQTSSFDIQSVQVYQP